MRAVAATDFVREFARYQDEAREEPVQVTSHNRTTGYFIAPREYEELQTLREKVARIVRVENLTEEQIKGLQTVSMDKSHDHLNALMDD
jgi:PHD/YefM family antitoxin component YafN of YafNO toxin-antitoxin module